MNGFQSDRRRPVLMSWREMEPSFSTLPSLDNTVISCDLPSSVPRGGCTIDTDDELCNVATTHMEHFDRWFINQRNATAARNCSRENDFTLSKRRTPTRKDSPSISLVETLLIGTRWKITPLCSGWCVALEFSEDWKLDQLPLWVGIVITVISEQCVKEDYCLNS